MEKIEGIKRSKGVRWGKGEMKRRGVDEK